MHTKPRHAQSCSVKSNKAQPLCLTLAPAPQERRWKIPRRACHPKPLYAALASLFCGNLLLRKVWVFCCGRAMCAGETDGLAGKILVLVR
jgi:hypothetical protein